MSRYDAHWMARVFDEYGEKEWERWERSHADQVKLHVHCHYIRLAVKEGDSVLEVGAGAGRFTQVLAELGAQIVVADISEGQLNLNRKHQIACRQLGGIGSARSNCRWSSLWQG